MADYPLWSSANPLSNVRDGGGWPIPGATGHGRRFGNAVDNVIDVFGHVDQASLNLPDWGLDADRGLAHLSWVFTGPYHVNGVAIGPQP